MGNPRPSQGKTGNTGDVNGGLNVDYESESMISGHKWSKSRLIPSESDIVTATVSAEV